MTTYAPDTRDEVELLERWAAAVDAVEAPVSMAKVDVLRHRSEGGILHVLLGVLPAVLRDLQADG